MSAIKVDGDGEGDRVCAAKTIAQWRFIGTLLWLLALVILGYLLYRMAVAPRYRHVSVTGEGRVKGAPNVAYVTLGVQTESENNATNAAQQNATRLQQVIQAIGGPDSPQRSIETLAYQVYPVRDRDGNVTKYRVSNRARVTLRGEQVAQRVSEVVDQATRAGANQMNGIQFDLSESGREQLEAQAHQQAVHDGEQKAQLLAKSAGASLGEVISLQEPDTGGGGGPQPRALMSAAADEAATPVHAPEHIEVVRRVEATYQLK